MPRFLSLVIGTLVGLLICSSDAIAEKPNVLFIAVDDLRPELNCYGKSHIQSPNIDRLAAQGTLFERAYCMVPTCGASRASLMTGIRPAPGRFVGYLARADKDAPGVTTLNTHFKKAGYRTLSQGKIFHNPADNAEGWSQPAWRPQQGSLTYQLEASRKARKENTQGRGRGPAYESAEAPDEDYADGQIALQAIDQLRELKERDEPFFLAVGFFKPHLPFVCPQKYWDLYDADQIELPETYHRPQNAPGAAIHTSGELRSYAGIPAKGPVSDETAKQMIHGYYACVSFIDAQVGKVLDELEQLGLAEDTIVVFWGDHGWNLGEHTLWCKHSCFETSMHAPLIVKAPGMAGGQKTAALTEFIDIYPTLCELAGLDKPSHLQGQSFVPLLKDPGLKWKEAAIGRFGAGDTIRTNNFRYSEYTNPNGKLRAKMLYDHQTDPQEDNNIVEQPKVKEQVQQLSQQLETGKGK